MANHIGSLNQTVTGVSSGIALSQSVPNSGIAKSLLSASLDQILHGQFNIQAGDIVTLVVTAIVIINFIAPRLRGRRFKRSSTERDS